MGCIFQLVAMARLGAARAKAVRCKLMRLSWTGAESLLLGSAPSSPGQRDDSALSARNPPLASLEPNVLYTTPCRRIGPLRHDKV